MKLGSLHDQMETKRRNRGKKSRGKGKGKNKGKSSPPGGGADGAGAGVRQRVPMLNPVEKMQSWGDDDGDDDYHDFDHSIDDSGGVPISPAVFATTVNAQEASAFESVLERERRISRSTVSCQP